MAPRILVVDDVPVNLTLLRMMLEREGYEVLVAGNGREALAVAETEKPDLVLLDVMMPILDGYATCAAMQRNPDTRDIPVIFLSALREACDKVKARRLGAVDTVAKPFNEGEILTRVASHLEIRRLRNEVAGSRRLESSRAARAEAELEAVARMLPGLLPRVPAEAPSLRWRGASDGALPARRIHAALALDDDRSAAFFLAVSGEGAATCILAAAAARETTTLLMRAAREGGDVRPAEILAALDDRFPFAGHARLLRAACLILHRPSGVLRAAVAGLAPPLLERDGATAQRIGDAGPPLGLGELGGLAPVFPEATTTLRPGDRIALRAALGEAESVLLVLEESAAPRNGTSSAIPVFRNEARRAA